jgi:hypothetical protein
MMVCLIGPARWVQLIRLAPTSASTAKGKT